MSDQERLAGYVAVWWLAVTDLLALLESLTEEEWSAPTDLPGWDVRAIASHVAHLEAILAGGEEETADVDLDGVPDVYQTEDGTVVRTVDDEAAHEPGWRGAPPPGRPARPSADS